MIKCSECNEPVHDKDTCLCDKHYKRHKRHGSPHQLYGVDDSMYSDICRACAKPAEVKSKGLCQAHYKQWQRAGKPEFKKPKRPYVKGGRYCTVTGCDKKAQAQSLCPKHLRRWKKYGDVNFERPFQKPRDHYICTEDGCGREHVARGLCARHLGKFYRMRDREVFLNAYGHTCQCCGESRSEFLALDHIDKSGYKDRKNGLYSRRLHQRLKKQGYPKDNYRLLCHNCNQSLGHYGYCPHKKMVSL